VRRGKARIFSGCDSRPDNWSLQPVAIGAAAEVTKPSKPSRQRTALQVVEVEQDGKRFLLRSEAQGTCGKVFQAVGVALPPTVQQVAPTTPGEDAAQSATPPG
jgi:hypothetical protein